MTCLQTTGPFVSALANRYGFRVVTICGALLAATGFALSSTAETVEFLCFSYGVIGGRHDATQVFITFGLAANAI